MFHLKFHLETSNRMIFSNYHSEAKIGILGLPSGSLPLVALPSLPYLLTSLGLPNPQIHPLVNHPHLGQRLNQATSSSPPPSSSGDCYHLVFQLILLIVVGHYPQLISVQI